MKKIALLLGLTLFYTLSFAQKNKISVEYSFSQADLIRGHFFNIDDELIGSASYDVQKPFQMGIKYSREFPYHFSIETGLEYFQTDIKIAPVYFGIGTPKPYSKNLQLVSIPIYLNYTFFKYFFINGRLLLDWQLKNNDSFDNQTGIGYGFGIGLKYDFENFSVSLSQNLREHAFIPFKKEKHQQRLVVDEVKISVGYRF